MVGALGLDAIVSAPPERALRTAAALGRLRPARAAAGCITPYGWQSMLMTVRILGLGPALSIIGEWQRRRLLPSRRARGRPAARPRRRPLARRDAAAGAHRHPARPHPHGALGRAQRRDLRPARAAHRRPPAGEPVRRHPRRAARGRRPGAVRQGRGLLLVVLVPATFALVGGVPLCARPPTSPRRPPSPRSRRPIPARSSTSTISAAIWSMQACPTFIDGRTELYGGAFFARYYSAVTLADLARLRAPARYVQDQGDAARPRHAGQCLARPPARLAPALCRRHRRGPRARLRRLDGAAAPGIPAAMPEIVSIYRYPVKGLSPEPLASVRVAAGETLPFDRAWAIENGPSKFDPAAPRHLPKIAFLMLMRNERLAALADRASTRRRARSPSARTARSSPRAVSKPKRGARRWRPSSTPMRPTSCAGRRASSPPPATPSPTRPPSACR